MHRTKTTYQSSNVVRDLFPGESFIDHGGNMVERISETDILIGPGYNFSMRIRDYLASIRAEYHFGRYLLPVGD